MQEGSSDAEQPSSQTCTPPPCTPLLSLTSANAHTCTPPTCMPLLSLQQMHTHKHTHLHHAHPSYQSPQQMVLRIKFLRGLGLKELGPPLPHLSLRAPHIDVSVHLHKNFVQSSRTQCFLSYQVLAHYFLHLEHSFPS